MPKAHLPQKGKKFIDIISMLTENEQLFLNAILKQEKLTLEASIFDNGGVHVLAILNNQMSLASKLFEAGANIYAEVAGESFLAYATQRGKDDIVALLLQHGADRFLADPQEKALRNAVAFNRSTCVELLLQHSPYNPEKDESTFLDCAKYDSIDYLKKLLGLTAHSEQRLIAALHNAIKFEANRAVKLLVDTMEKNAISQALVGLNLSTCNETIVRLLSIKLGPLNIENPVSQPKPIFTYPLEGIRKEDAIYSLYELAANSEEGLQQRLLGLSLTANVSGLYSPLPKYEVVNSITEAMSRPNGRIGSLGFLQDIGIRLQTDALNITAYLEIYKLPESVVTAKLSQLKNTKAKNVLADYSEANTHNPSSESYAQNMSSGSPRSTTLPQYALSYPKQIEDSSMEYIQDAAQMDKYKGKIIVLTTTSSYFFSNGQPGLTALMSFMLDLDRGLRVGSVSSDLHYWQSGGQGYTLRLLLAPPKSVDSNKALVTSHFKDAEFKVRLPSLSELDKIKEAILNGTARFEYSRDASDMARDLKAVEAQRQNTLELQGEKKTHKLRA